MRPPNIIVRTFVLSLTLATTASAQVTLKTTATELKDGVLDVFYVWTSPVRAKPRDVIGAIGVTAGAAALWPVDDQVDSWIVRHPNAALVRAFTPWDENHPELGDLSTGQRLLPISAVLITSGNLRGSVSTDARRLFIQFGCCRQTMAQN